MTKGKLLATYWVFGIISLLTMNINAQPAYKPYFTSFSVMLGRSVPIGSFASMSGTNSGFAKVGLCAEIKSNTSLYPRLAWINSINVSTNAFNQVAYCDDEPNINISTGRHFTGWALTGLALDIPISDSFTPYVSGQIGLLVSSFPDITLKRHIEDENLIINYQMEQTAKPATAIAYGLTVGLKVKLIHLAIRYNYAAPRYNTTLKSGFDSYYLQTIRSTMEVPTGMLQFLMGINF
jgi:hypothetical protein